MKAWEHYRESELYAAKAAENADFGGALVGAVLGLTHALQALVMLQAMGEINFPRDRAEWREQWRGLVPPQTHD